MLDRTLSRLRLPAHLVVIGLVLADSGWAFADALKRQWIERVVGPVLPWATHFRHPKDAALLPYVAAGLVALAWGLLVYVRLRPPATRLLLVLRRAAGGRSLPVLAAVVLGQPFVVTPGPFQAGLALASAFACLVPLPSARLRSLRRPLVIPSLRRFHGPFALLCALGTVGVLVGIAAEPVKLSARPLQLLTEYEQLPQRFRAAPDRPRTGAGACEFQASNPIEFAYQSHNRGPINHIGHILNPINELETGKPAQDVYLQYGRGATLAFKWMMDRFGGASLQAYRKTLLFYVAYWLLFAAGAALLFRDPRYAFAAVAFEAISYYHLGYEPLILAPGVNPILHFLDVPVLLLALGLFRSGQRRWLVLAAAGATAAFWLNGFFGSMLCVALLVSAGLWALETSAPGKGLRRLVTTSATIVVPLSAVAATAPRSGGGSVFSQFLGGYFSWEPHPGLVLFALAYLTVGYAFLVWTRSRRDPLKYASVFLFVYTQGLLVYFFWSGLENHFWPVLPYAGFHALLMLYVAGRERALARIEPWVLTAIIALLVAVGREGVHFWIRNRADVRAAFSVQETWRWPFARADVISTADPAPLVASVAQLERYPSADRSVAILSVFDDLVPFLAARHSLLPHFELQWALLTEADRDRAIGTLERARPRYLFVGREVEVEQAPWVGTPCVAFMRPERDAQTGRLREMHRVFEAVAGDYERLEAGPLLSVYRRRDSGAGASAAGASR